jgi:hypothetical protein
VTTVLAHRQISSRRLRGSTGTGPHSKGYTGASRRAVFGEESFITAGKTDPLGPSNLAGFRKRSRARPLMHKPAPSASANRPADGRAQGVGARLSWR